MKQTRIIITTEHNFKLRHSVHAHSVTLISCHYEHKGIVSNTAKWVVYLFQLWFQKKVK